MADQKCRYEGDRLADIESQSAQDDGYTPPYLHVRYKSPMGTVSADLIVVLRFTDNPSRAATKTGMKRLALSNSDKQVRNWFVDTTKSLGCEVTVDEMGNIFAVRPGRRSGVAPIFVGSHLDTQPTGGRYDGILGVLAGVEMLKVLQDTNVETEYPIGVVNWTKCVLSKSSNLVRVQANR